MRLTTIVLIAATSLLLVACDNQPLRVGSKSFTEQKLLGEMIAQVAENADIPVTRGIPYGNGESGTVLAGIKQGKLDVYPPYTGTALELLGQVPTQDADGDYKRVSQLFKPLDLIWRQRFGFSDNYVLVMQADQAQKLHVKTVSDLANVGDGVRFVANKEFVQRPRDGLTPLTQRYGITQSGKPVVKEDVNARYAALLDGTADVAMGFSTDGQIAEYDLRVLKDDKQFFPVYQPAPLVRADALKRYPALGDALAKLGGSIDDKTMRRLNKAVDIEGKDYQAVAHDFLVSKGLIAGATKGAGSNPITIAADPLQSPAGSVRGVLAAVRKGFQGRSVTLSRTAAPMDALAKGDARVALVGADTFYDLQDGKPVQRKAGVALARVGFQYVHILTKRDSNGSVNAPGLASMSSLAVPVANGPSAHVAEFILAGLGLDNKIKLMAPEKPSLQAAAQMVKQGKADGLLMIAPEQYPGLGRLMRSGVFRLVSLDHWSDGNNAVKFPFLRQVTLPKNSYANMQAPAATIGAQLVLAGPAPGNQAIGDAGPASGAPPDRPPPILADAVKTINAALGETVSIDTSLPLGAGLKPELPDLNTSINPSGAVSVTNFLVIIVIIYLFYLFVREGSDRRRGS